MVRGRAGRAHDPVVAAAFLDQAETVVAGLDGIDPWQAVLDAEPGAPLVVVPGEVDEVLAVVADFADLASPTMLGHSRAVAELAEAAAWRSGCDRPTVRLVRRAGLVHDLGRVGVPVAVWDKPGPLTTTEWERVRLHPYLTERVVSRCGWLAPLASVAAAHHERTDGSGYPHGWGRERLAYPSRLLAAADAYQAMTSPRPHRPALAPRQAARVLAEQAAAGRLDPEATAAVLGAAGERGCVPVPDWPAGLTDREVQVLRLVAGGLTNRVVADHLGISAKTVGHHVQHVYRKIGVATRAGAAVWALQHGVLPPPG